MSAGRARREKDGLRTGSRKDSLQHTNMWKKGSHGDRNRLNKKAGEREDLHHVSEIRREQPPIGAFGLFKVHVALASLTSCCEHHAG